MGCSIVLDKVHSMFSEFIAFVLVIRKDSWSCTQFDGIDAETSFSEGKVLQWNTRETW